MIANELLFDYNSMRVIDSDKQTGSNPIFKVDAMYGNVPVTVIGKFQIDSIEMRQDFDAQITVLTQMFICRYMILN